jgi:hypothetical protein
MRARAFAKVWRMLRSAGPARLEKSSPPSKQDVAYQVRLTYRAERDLDLLYESIGAEHFEARSNGIADLNEQSCLSNKARFGVP